MFAWIIFCEKYNPPFCMTYCSSFLARFLSHDYEGSLFLWKIGTCYWTTWHHMSASGGLNTFKFF
jgi:hypothetical protein